MSRGTKFNFFWVKQASQCQAQLNLSKIQLNFKRHECFSELSNQHKNSLKYSLVKIRGLYFVLIMSLNKLLMASMALPLISLILSKSLFSISIKERL
jgi:hypothetical protein